VVGPTKLQPRFFRSFDIAIDSADVPSLQRRQRQCASGASARCGLEAPGVGRERAELLAQLEHALRVVDRRLDLAAMAHDAGVGEQPLDVAFAEARDALGVEAAKPRGRPRACSGW
jgi:hypothetical protein